MKFQICQGRNCKHKEISQGKETTTKTTQNDSTMENQIAWMQVVKKEERS